MQLLAPFLNFQLDLQAQELVSNENILLQTLGFDVAIDHPHTHVVKCCQLVKGACARACPCLVDFLNDILGAIDGNDGSGKRILMALVPASKELAQTSYFMATNSLHLTTMCLRYPPTIVACVCIHLACKWSKYEIPISGEVIFAPCYF